MIRQGRARLYSVYGRSQLQCTRVL